MSPRAAVVALVFAATVVVPPAAGDDLSAARDGDVIRAEPSAFHLDPLRLVKVDGRVTKILYRSAGRTGNPIAVSGTVIEPRAPWRGPGKRPLVGYAPGTQGLTDKCAPSHQLSAGTEYEGPFIAGLLARGYAVAITDYEGLGTPGPHMYRNRVPQGNALLDVVRAAQRLPAADIPDDGPVAVTGYSQGGMAAAAAVELAATRAPELDLVGAVVGGASTNPALIPSRIDGGANAALLAYALLGYSAGYGLDPGAYLTERGSRVVAEIAEQCTVEALARHPFLRTGELTRSGVPISDLIGTDPVLRRIAAEQRIGAVAPSAPVLISHSRFDEVNSIENARVLLSDWCARGGRVALKPNVAPSHASGAFAAFPAMFAWLEGRFTSETAPSDC